CARAPTWVQLVPSMLRAVVAAADPARPAGLRFIRSVSAALPTDLKAEAEARLRVPVVEIYGMTETAGVITSNPLDPADQRPGSVGIAVGPDVAIRDPEGRMLPEGSEGEVVISGRQVSPGYIAAAPEDAVAFGPDGFHSGDLGRIDRDGHLWLVGRRKDLINRGGEMIAPAEIEAALLAVPGVADAAVFGVPHATLGEEIAAAIVPAGPEPMPDLCASVRSSIRAVLGHGRLPASLHVVDAIPRTAGGKLQRRILAARYAAAPEAPSPGVVPRRWPDAPLARWVAEIWAPIVGLPVMGEDDDFFGAGGGSLQAAQAAAVVQDRFPDEIVYVSSVYEAPTPRLQAAFLEANHPLVAARVLSSRRACWAGRSVPGGRWSSR
ncbi:MAG: AMP-binding protein, partial [Rhizobiales bacterium]|nr:AMP-binding protein [Hyphomicrobiales bacterium]